MVRFRYNLAHQRVGTRGGAAHSISMAKIIGFTGAAGAGKTTAARHLVATWRERAPVLVSVTPDAFMAGAHSKTRLLSRKAIVLSLATPLKDVCKQIFPQLPAACFYGTKEEKEAPIESLDGFEGWTGRRILQHIGTEGFRHVNPNVWALLLAYQIDALKDEYGLIVIDDIRFLNEAAVLSSALDALYRIDRPGLEAMSHASEQEHTRIPVTGVLNNHGTLEEFRTSLGALV